VSKHFVNETIGYLTEPQILTLAHIIGEGDLTLEEAIKSYCFYGLDIICNDGAIYQTSWKYSKKLERDMT